MGDNKKTPQDVLDQGEFKNLLFNIQLDPQSFSKKMVSYLTSRGTKKAILK